MTEISCEYNPRLIIDNHFFEIRNELDIIVETLFDQNRELTESEKNEINAMRGKQIDRINEIEQINMSQWPYNFDKQRYELEWIDSLKDTSLTEEKKMEKIKKSLIKSDAMKMKDRCLITKSANST